jgi:predicted transcriptional regulator of viral defense system
LHIRGSAELFVNGDEILEKQMSLKLETLLKKQNGIIRTRDFLDAGISKYYIHKLESMGEIIRLKQGVYRQPDGKSELTDEIVDVTKLVPRGVICLLSALSYYELTTYNPWEYQIAIHRRDKKPRLPDYPPIKIMYFADDQYHTGIDTVYIEGSGMKIYNREKTICDIIRYRNKLGIDLMKEGLRNYLKQPGSNITKLVAYADKLRIRTVLQKYLEVLV